MDAEYDLDHNNYSVVVMVVVVVVVVDNVDKNKDPKPYSVKKAVVEEIEVVVGEEGEVSHHLVSMETYQENDPLLDTEGNPFGRWVLDAMVEEEGYPP